MCQQWPGHTEAPEMLPVQGRADIALKGVSSSSHGPCACPAASQLPGKLIFPGKIAINPFFPPHFGNVPFSTKLLPGKVSQAGICSPCVEKPPGRCQQLVVRAEQWWDLRWPVSNADLRPELPTSLTLCLQSRALTPFPTKSINQKI